MELLSSLIRTSAEAVAQVGDVGALSDESLLSAAASVAVLRRHADAAAAAIAGEIAHRSRRELGYDGLAITAGFADATAMVSSVTQTSKTDARKLVEVGSLSTESAWRSLVSSRVAAGELSVDAASSITHGLAGIDDRVASDDLVGAVRTLLALRVAPDELFRRARRLRDELDAVGIAGRVAAQRDARTFSIWHQPDGMYRGRFLLDPEDGALVDAALQSIMSPRRGGPRFVDPAARASAEELLADPRTNEQLSADAFVDIVRLAIDADPGTLFGARRPSVRISITTDQLASATGHGVIEGTVDAVTVEGIDRLVCDAGVVALKFDRDGNCLNIGRDQRLFTTRQRAVLEHRDGGCRFPGCDRPPSQCEAHHIDEWHLQNGRTDVADGILLCRRHHMLLHNNCWQIVRDGTDYWLLPPAHVSPDRIAMPSRSAWSYSPSPSPSAASTESSKSAGLRRVTSNEASCSS
jgi:hypothetical protein